MEKNYIKFDIKTGKVLAFFNAFDITTLPPDIVEINDQLGTHLFNYVVDLSTKRPLKLKQLILDTKIKLTKQIAENKLKNTDWKVTRHQEQKSLNLQTSLSDANFIVLLNSRQSIRNASKQIETYLNGLTDVNIVESFDPINNTYWPQ